MSDGLAPVEPVALSFQLRLSTQLSTFALDPLDQSPQKTGQSSPFPECTSWAPYLGCGDLATADAIPNSKVSQVSRGPRDPRDPRARTLQVFLADGNVLFVHFLARSRPKNSGTQHHAARCRPKGTSDKSDMWEEKSGSPCTLK